MIGSGGWVGLGEGGFNYKSKREREREIRKDGSILRSASAEPRASTVDTTHPHTRLTAAWGVRPPQEPVVRPPPPHPLPQQSSPQLQLSSFAHEALLFRPTCLCSKRFATFGCADQHAAYSLAMAVLWSKSAIAALTSVSSSSSKSPSATW